MATLSQKNIDQYLADKDINQDQKEKVLAAITHLVYNRNQNVIKFEMEKNEDKKNQYQRSVDEYDQMIKSRINEVLDGKNIETYDF